MASTSKSFNKMRVAVITLLVLVLSACGLEPWVKPYERANLSDPIMSFSRNPISDSYLNHVYQAREAARGAELGQGGGCGCN
ncbi:MAG: DUF4266 domain-containing protein [Gammaproteobacteria bacterium]|nr:DUF4266 domain-containing protein [Gammaproteobacteria bacterium]MDH5802066.1 DUF4266 domain-containing protein [Gammaproteobacteria bacterium]